MEFEGSWVSITYYNSKARQKSNTLVIPSGLGVDRHPACNHYLIILAAMQSPKRAEFTRGLEIWYYDLVDPSTTSPAALPAGSFDSARLTLESLRTPRGARDSPGLVHGRLKCLHKDTLCADEDGTRLALTNNCPYGVRRDVVALRQWLNDEPLRRLDW